MIRKAAFAIVASVTLGLAPAVLAQPAPAGASPEGGQGRGGALRAACAADTQKLCADAQDRQARRECLIQNKDRLSPDCAAALTAVRGAQQK